MSYAIGLNTLHALLIHIAIKMVFAHTFILDHFILYHKIRINMSIFNWHEGTAQMTQQNSLGRDYNKRKDHVILHLRGPYQ